jgi:Matrixin
MPLQRSPGQRMGRSLAITAAAVALLGARPAGAFCRSATCPASGAGGTGGSTQGQDCVPAESGDCKIPLQWRQPCVSFSVQQDASKQVDYATADRVLTRAFATWAAVDCGGGGPSIQVFDFSPVSCDLVEYNQQAGNANLLVFRDAKWPHDTGGGGVDTLALTTVTYDVDTGDIYDADIEVNTADNTFSTDDDPGATDVDLQSVLTHETGHFLGLAHTQVYPATMFASYTPGTITIRTLAGDDQDAICAAYPVSRQATGACTGIPRHGFAPICGAQQTYVRCSASPARSEVDASALGAGLALAAAARFRRRAGGGRLRGRRARRGW